MKKNIVLLFIFSSFLITAEKTDNLERKFIIGNIEEKIESVQESDSSNALKMSEKGIDYALSNVEVLGSNTELSALAEASILNLIKNVSIENLDNSKSKALSIKLLEIFNKFDDENVKITTVDCLSRFNDVKWNGTVDVFNNYLEARYKENHPGNFLIGNIISALGNFGDRRSLSVIYNIWTNRKWPEYQQAEEKSIVSLCESLQDDAKKIILYSDNSKIEEFLMMILKSDRNKDNLKENVAETALFSAINNVESSHEFSKSFYLIQKEALEALSSAKWSHAEKIVLKNFDAAEKEYDMKFISDDEFVEIINLTAKFSTADIAEAFSKLLGEFNSRAEKTEIPSEPVALALIKSLGELGNKTAFDNLLYVTYLSYPDKVIGAAKNSLAKLKW